MFESESRLLRANGHVVQQEVFRNDGISDDRSVGENVRLAMGTVWSRTGRRHLAHAVREFRPDVVHFHNTFPLMSPASMRRIFAMGVPVVQTLHNYRMICPSAFLFRDGRICHDCLGRRVAWPGIRHACYQGSRVRTATVASMQAVHRALGTWWNSVDVYIATTGFAREIFVDNGLPPESVVVKPNFVESDFGPGSHEGGFALFVGRLSKEKGLGTLIKAWDKVPGTFELKIAGDGPLREFVEDASQRNPTIKMLGHVSEEEVLRLMGDAAVVVFPSEWNETFGRTVIEAYSRGTPVVASDIGSTRELVRQGETGTIVPIADPDAMARALSYILQDSETRRRMGCNARRMFEDLYSTDQNYARLYGIYRMAIERADQRKSNHVQKSGLH